jgi:ribosomal protein S18 acetylase RimI-like enzyme
MTPADWRLVSTPSLAPLYERERAWWSDHLQWDTRESWMEVDEARLAGRLPGVVIHGASGDVQALAYGVVLDGIAQLGPLVADSSRVAACLLDGLIEATRAPGIWATSYFGPATEGVEDALLRAGFETDRYCYLSRPLDDTPLVRAAPLEDRWKDADLGAVSYLLWSAYGATGRYFAPRGRLDEWEQYARTLILYTGCGRFDPVATQVARDAQGLTGLVVVTTVSDDVAHLAQVAVRPDARSQGLAGRLVDRAMAAAAARGLRQVTLLVDAAAEPARRLYASRGFTERATFVAAWRQEPGA